jgi:hypothetical protein
MVSSLPPAPPRNPTHPSPSAPTAANRWRKEKPDAYRIPAIPESAYHKLGGIEKKPLYVLALGWMLGGAVVTEPKEVELPRGTVRIDMNQTWGSMESLQEDVYAAVGHRFTRNQVRYATLTLVRRGMITDLGNVFPETKGKYGKLYGIDPSLLETDEPHMDVVRGYQMFHYGDPQDFKIGEIVVGNFKANARAQELMAHGYTYEHLRRNGLVEEMAKRGKYGRADLWMAQVAREGLDKPAFTSIGRWRTGEAGDEDAPVLIPLFTIDIDRRNMVDAWQDALEIVSRLDRGNYDLSRCFVSFSGSKGFHVQITADQFGTPIFSDSRAAREMAGIVASSLTYGMERDATVESPNSLIRITGSKHGQSGMYRTTWRADQFESLDLEEILHHASQHIPSQLPEAVMGEAVEEVKARFEKMAESASRTLYERMRNRRMGGGSATGEAINSLLGGVEESVEWNPNYPPSREWAAYILACWLYEGKRTGDDKIDAADTVLDKMKVWNERNVPNLTPGQIRGRLMSAKRTVGA